jgi:long-chain fatty acid transport protein
MWSTLQEVNKTIQNVPLIGTIQEVEVMNFKNILLFHTGCEFQVAEGLYLRAGIGYDRSASPAESLNFTNIDVDKFTLLGGIGYRAGRVTLDFAYVYAQGKEREKSVITATGFPGLERYNMNVNILGLGVTFHF